MTSAPPLDPAPAAPTGFDLFQNAFDHAAIGMALVATDGRWLKVNRALCRITGYAEEELTATDFQSITHPGDLDADLASVGRLLAGEIESYQMEKRYLHRDGRVVWVLLSASLLRDDDGEPLYFIAQVQDVTERKRADRALRAAHARMAMLIEEIRAGVLLADEHRRVLLVNGPLCRMFELPDPPGRLAGADHDEVVRRLAAAFPDPDTFVAGVDELVRGRAAVRNEQLTLADGRTFERDGRPIFLDEEYRGHVWEYRDVTSRVETERFHEEQTRRLREANDRLAALAATDPLTELPNRRALRERLADALEAAGRAGRPVSLALLDVDRFKQFNDAFGHPAGDDVLRAFAALLRRASRSGDLPARFGGEEFAILLPDADAREASAAAERLRGAIEGAAWPLRPVTASFGVATVFPPSQPDDAVADVLIAAADAALYRSKAAGRNRVTHADEAFEGEAFEGEAFEGEAFEGEAFEGEAFEGEAFEGEAFEEAAPADGRPRPAR